MILGMLDPGAKCSETEADTNCQALSSPRPIPALLNLRFDVGHQQDRLMVTSTRAYQSRRTVKYEINDLLTNDSNVINADRDLQNSG